MALASSSQQDPSISTATTIHLRNGRNPARKSRAQLLFGPQRQTGWFDRSHRHYSTSSRSIRRRAEVGACPADQLHGRENRQKAGLDERVPSAGAGMTASGDTSSLAGAI
jgi:hypothetical protein